MCYAMIIYYCSAFYIAIYRRDRRPYMFAIVLLLMLIETIPVVRSDANMFKLCALAGVRWRKAPAIRTRMTSAVYAFVIVWGIFVLYMRQWVAWTYAWARDSGYDRQFLAWICRLSNCCSVHAIASLFCSGWDTFGGITLFQNGWTTKAFIDQIRIYLLIWAQFI